MSQGPARIESPVLRIRVDKIEIKKKDVYLAVNELIFRTRAPNLGVEFLRDKEHVGPQIYGRHISLKLEDVTVRRVLDAIIKRDPRYTYIERDGYIIVVHRETIGDPSYMLHRKLHGRKLSNMTLRDFFFRLTDLMKRTIGKDASISKIPSVMDRDPADLSIELGGKSLRRVLIEVAKARRSSYDVIIEGRSIHFDATPYKPLSRHQLLDD